jgi:hypothetical protein
MLCVDTTTESAELSGIAREDIWHSGPVIARAIPGEVKEGECLFPPR